MRQRRLTKEEYSLIREYIEVREKYEALRQAIEGLKLEMEEDTELTYKGFVIGKVSMVKSRRIDFSKIPPQLKEELNRFYVEKPEKRLIITGISTQPKPDKVLKTGGFLLKKFHSFERGAFVETKRVNSGCLRGLRLARVFGVRL